MELTKRINAAAGDLKEKNMWKLSYRQITQWLLDIGLLEWKDWAGKKKRFPTPIGESIGLVRVMWENYGRKSPVVYFSLDAQRFILDNLDAVIATQPQRKKSYVDESSESEDEEL